MPASGVGETGKFEDFYFRWSRYPDAIPSTRSHLMFRITSQDLSLSRSIVMIGLLQLLCISAGFFAVGIILKLSGWPEIDDPTIRWNPYAVFLRNFGWVFVVVPLVWTIYAAVSKEIDEGWWNFEVALVVGVIIPILFLLVFILSALSPYTRSLMYLFN